MGILNAWQSVVQTLSPSAICWFLSITSTAAIFTLSIRRVHTSAKAGFKHQALEVLAIWVLIPVLANIIVSVPFNSRWPLRQTWLIFYIETAFILGMFSALIYWVALYCFAAWQGKSARMILNPTQLEAQKLRRKLNKNIKLEIVPFRPGRNVHDHYDKFVKAIYDLQAIDCGDGSAVQLSDNATTLLFLETFDIARPEWVVCVADEYVGVGEEKKTSLDMKLVVALLEEEELLRTVDQAVYPGTVDRLWRHAAYVLSMIVMPTIVLGVYARWLANVFEVM
ncbi:hypothetical protein LTR62_008505 [Meristemomyces frigidus]|uniref:Uncharacterized protein n=1 Tax=Meristemomyces frigidus TaxID=1508187 RepID=A0AAN7YM72_9PEZI|nr:hypothetical protein LTR62_008505 [Meristemomyces frigidus]